MLSNCSFEDINQSLVGFVTYDLLVLKYCVFKFLKKLTVIIRFAHELKFGLSARTTSVGDVFISPALIF